MSQIKFLIVALVIAAAIGLNVWVGHLNNSIASLSEQLDKANAANTSLAAAVNDKTVQIETERSAVTSRDNIIKTLEKQLKSRSQAYDENTKTDVCANSIAPDNVLVLMQ